MKLEDVTVGLKVSLVANPSELGIVIKLATGKVQVDFGGRKGWKTPADLDSDGAAAAPAAAPAKSTTSAKPGQYEVKFKTVIRAGFEKDSEKAGLVKVRVAILVGCHLSTRSCATV